MSVELFTAFNRAFYRDVDDATEALNALVDSIAEPTKTMEWAVPILRQHIADGLKYDQTDVILSWASDYLMEVSWAIRCPGANTNIFGRLEPNDEAYEYTTLKKAFISNMIL